MTASHVHTWGKTQRATAMVEEIAEVESVGELTIRRLSRPVPAANVLSTR